jgi:hypothetical protein
MARRYYLSIETFEKHPLLSNICVRLKFQSSEYSKYACG